MTMQQQPPSWVPLQVTVYLQQVLSFLLLLVQEAQLHHHAEVTSFHYFDVHRMVRNIFLIKPGSQLLVKLLSF